MCGSLIVSLAVREGVSGGSQILRGIQFHLIIQHRGGKMVLLYYWWHKVWILWRRRKGRSRMESSVLPKLLCVLVILH